MTANAPPPNAPTPGAARARPRRWLRRVVAAAGIAALVTGGAGIWLAGHLEHPWIKQRVQDLANELVGAKLNYERASVDTRGFELYGLRIDNSPADQAQVGPLFSARVIRLQWTVGQLLASPRRLALARVEGVALGAVVGGSGGGSWARALELPASATPTEEGPPPSRWLSLPELARDYALDALEVDDVAIRIAVAGNEGVAAITGGELRARFDGSAEAPLTLQLGGRPLQLRIDGVGKAALAQRGADWVALGRAFEAGLPPELVPLRDRALDLADAATRAVAAAADDAALAVFRSEVALRIDLRATGGEGPELGIEASARTPELEVMGRDAPVRGADDFAALHGTLRGGDGGLALSRCEARITLDPRAKARQAVFALIAAVRDPTAPGAAAQATIASMSAALDWPPHASAKLQAARFRLSPTDPAGEVTATATLERLALAQGADSVELDAGRAAASARWVDGALAVHVEAGVGALDARVRGASLLARAAQVGVDAGARVPADAPLRLVPAGPVQIRGAIERGAFGAGEALHGRVESASMRLDIPEAGVVAGLAGGLPAFTLHTEAQALEGSSGSQRSALVAPRLDLEFGPEALQASCGAERLSLDNGGERLSVERGTATVTAAGWRRPSDHVFELDSFDLVAKCPRASWSGRTLPSDALSTIELRRLAVDDRAPLQAQLGRLLLDARVPGLRANLTARRAGDGPLHWDGRFALDAPLAMAAALGQRIRASDAFAVRELGAVVGKSSGQISVRRMPGPGATLPQWLAAVGLQHQSGLQIGRIVARSQGRVVRLAGLDLSAAGTLRPTGLHTDFELLPRGVQLDGGALPTLSANGSLEVSATATGLRGARGAAHLLLDGKERAEAAFAVERGAGWVLEASTKVRKLGSLGAKLAASMPCIDGGRLSGEGALRLELPLRALDDPATLGRWAQQPERAVGKMHGSTTIHGLRCHQDGFDAASPQVEGGLDLELGKGQFAATFTGGVLRLRGATGARPFDLRKIAGTLKIHGPIDRQLRGVRMQGEATLGRLRQDIMPALRIEGASARLRAEIDRRGRLELEEVSFENPASGSRGRLHGRVDRIGLGEDGDGGVPGARGAALDGELEQSLDALPELFGVRVRGGAKLRFAVETGDFRVLGVQAMAVLDDVGARHAGLDAEMRGMTGQMPLRFELVRDGTTLLPLGGGRRSPWARWRFVDQQPFLSGDHFVAIQSLRMGKVEVGPLAGNASIDRDVFRLDQLEMRLLDGQLTGQCAIELSGVDTRVLLRGNVTGVRIPGHQGRIDANAALEIQPWRLAIQGRAQVLRLSKSHLELALDLLDPYREDVQANRARLALRLGYPKQMRLRFRHGFADVWIELGGLAELVRIDEIRGVALGPLMTRAVLPLLGDPPP